MFCTLISNIVTTSLQGNQLLTETQPWAASTPTKTTVEVRAAVLEALRVSGILLQPFIPSKAEQLLNALGVDPEQRNIAFASLGAGSIGIVTGGIRLFETPSSKK